MHFLELLISSLRTISLKEYSGMTKNHIVNNLDYESRFYLYIMLQKKNPKFLEKLFDLLEVHVQYEWECNECRSLKWNSKGDGFEINDIEKVE